MNRDQQIADIAAKAKAIAGKVDTLSRAEKAGYTGSDVGGAESYLKNYNPTSPSTTFDSTALSSTSNRTTFPSIQPTTGQSVLQAKADAVGLSTPTVYDGSQPVGPDAATSTGIKDMVKARLLKLIGTQAGQGDETVKLQEDNQVSEKQKALNDITNEYATRQRAYEKQRRELERNPGAVSAAAANANIEDLTRKGNEELADIAIRKSVALGDVNTALDIVKTKIEAKYEPIKNEIQGLKDYLSLNNDDLTESEKIQLQATIKEKEDAVNFQQQKDLIDYKAKIDTENQAQGVDAPLYNGLSTKTATAVRSQVAAFKTEPIVQNFSTVQEGYNFVKNLSDTTTNPADDQALIYSLAKVLDPGSVVREGEYATAQKYAQSWINAYGKGVSQAIAGTGFLSEQARKNIKATIQSRYNASLQTYTNLANNYAQGINALTGRDDGSQFLRNYAIGGLSNTNSAPVMSNGVDLSKFDFSGGGGTSQTTPAAPAPTNTSTPARPAPKNPLSGLMTGYKPLNLGSFFR